MKKQYKIFSFLSFLLAVTSCSDAVDFEYENPESTGVSREVCISASIDKETRLGYNVSEERIALKWDNSDYLTVFNGNDLNAGTTGTKFGLTDGSGTGKGVFSGVPDNAYQNGDKLYAFFGKNAGNPVTLNTEGNIDIDLSQQNGSLSDDYQYMFGETEYQSDSDNRFILHNLVSIIKVNITLPEGMNSIDNLTMHFNSDWGGITDKATIVLGTAPKSNVYTGTVVCPADSGTISNVTIHDFQVNNNVATTYFYVLPCTRYDSQGSWLENHKGFYFTTQESGKKYISVEPNLAKNIESGKAYELDITLYELEDFENESTANGASEPYKISNARQLCSFMLKTSKDMRNLGGVPYSWCNYLLTSDILLDNDLTWSGALLSNGSFDGANHTISGSLVASDKNRQEYGGFFSNIVASTVKDLNLNIDFYCQPVANNKGNYHYGCFGALTGSLSSGSLVSHCSVSGHIVTECGSIGGLVGELGGNMIEIIGCSSSAILETYSGFIGGVLSMGGIVGYSYYSERVFITGCSSTSQYLVNSCEGVWKSNYGGILGNGEQEQMTNIQGCWANLNLEIKLTPSDHLLSSGGICGVLQNGTIQNCYWKNGSGIVCNSGNIMVENCGEIDGITPSPEQIADMNNVISSTGWMFDAQGKIIKSGKTIVPSIRGEQW